MTVPPQGGGRTDPASLIALFDKVLNITLSLPQAADARTLLGLPPDMTADVLVVDALQARLRAIAASPLAQSPEANELRFALHAAASGLFNRDLTSTPIVALVKEDRSALSSPLLTRDSANVSHDHRPVDAIRLQARTILALHGGATPAAMHLLSSLAASSGLPLVTLIRLASADDSEGGSAQETFVTPASPPLRSLGDENLRTPVGRSVLDPPFHTSNSAPSPTSPSNHVVKGVAIAVAAGVGLLCCAAAAIILLIHFAPGRATLATEAAAATATNPATTSVAATQAATMPAPTSGTQGQQRPHILAESQSKGTDGQTASAPLVPVQSPQVGLEEWADITREIDRSAALMRTDTSHDAAQFIRAFDSLAINWPTATADQVTDAVRGLTDALYAASSNPQRLRTCIDAVILPLTPTQSALPAPSAVLKTIFSAGVVARLSRERDFPRDVVQQLSDLADKVTRGVGDTTFTAGARSQANALVERLIPDSPQLESDRSKQLEESWTIWVKAVGALHPQPAPAASPAPLNGQVLPTDTFSLALLAALDQLLAITPARGSNESVTNAIIKLTLALPWRDQDVARSWLLARFDDTAVAAWGLHALTAALANKSAVSGTDATMVLAHGATLAARSELRDRYAQRWSATGERKRREIEQRWRDAVAAELAKPITGLDVYALAAQSTIFSRHSAAAFVLMSPSAQVVDAELLAASLMVSQDAALASAINKAVSAPSRPPLAGELTPWAVNYLGSGAKIQERLSLLSQAPLSPTMAEARIILDQACRGAPERVQTQAMNVARRMSSLPTMAVVMLDFAPFITPSAANAELVRMVTGSTSIPSTKDASWRVAVRRALVERALEVVSASSPGALIELLADTFAEDYAIITDSLPKPGIFTPAARVSPLDVTVNTPPRPPAEVGAQAAAHALEAVARTYLPSGREPHSLSAIVARRSARERLTQRADQARGNRVHAFLAAQTSVVEVFAYIVACEQPSKVGLLRTLLEKARRDNQQAGHAFEQFYTNERLLLELWCVRLNIPLGPPQGQPVVEEPSIVPQQLSVPGSRSGA